MPTVYTFTTKPPLSAQSEGKVRSHYENQPNDGARVSIQGIGNGPMTTDASASIVSSPVAVSTTLATNLTTPESAIEITLICATNTARVSEVNASVITYFPLPSGSPVTIDIANCNNLYLLAPAATATVAFYYTLV